MKKNLHSILIACLLLIFFNSAFGQEVPGGESNGIAILQPDPGISLKTTLRNYPNPVINITTVNYSIPFAGNIILKIYSTSGKEIATLFSGCQQAGSYTVNFDAGRLTSGVYICSLMYKHNNKSVIISKKIDVTKLS